MIVAVIAALAAGCSFAVGSVLQQSAASEAPPDKALSWRLIADLVRRPRWLLGISSDVGSFGLQALALAFGPLALVQPLLVTGVLFAVPLSARLRGRRLAARDWVATAAVSGGLAMFLAAAAPVAGTPDTTISRWTLLFVAAGGVMLVGIAVGRSIRGPARATFYALGAGCAFGVLAALTKTSTWLLGQGPGAFFTAWQPYAMAGVAAAGMIVQQSAFQAGPLAASLPVMDALEPSTAVLIGVFAFGEHLTTGPGAFAMEAIGILAVLGGVVVLDRSPLVRGTEPAAQPARRVRSSSPSSGKRETTVSSGNSESIEVTG